MLFFFSNAAVLTEYDLKMAINGPPQPFKERMPSSTIGHGGSCVTSPATATEQAAALRQGDG